MAILFILTTNLLPLVALGVTPPASTAADCGNSLEQKNVTVELLREFGLVDPGVDPNSNYSHARARKWFGDQPITVDRAAKIIFKNGNFLYLEYAIELTGAKGEDILLALYKRDPDFYERFSNFDFWAMEPLWNTGHRTNEIQEMLINSFLDKNSNMEIRERNVYALEFLLKRGIIPRNLESFSNYAGILRSITFLEEKDSPSALLINASSKKWVSEDPEIAGAIVSDSVQVKRSANFKCGGCIRMSNGHYHNLIARTPIPLPARYFIVVDGKVVGTIKLPQHGEPSVLALRDVHDTNGRKLLYMGGVYSIVETDELKLRYGTNVIDIISGFRPSKNFLSLDRLVLSPIAFMANRTAFKKQDRSLPVLLGMDEEMGWQDPRVASELWPTLLREIAKKRTEIEKRFKKLQSQ